MTNQIKNGTTTKGQYNKVTYNKKQTLKMASSTIINSEGKCPYHPVIQLKRKHRRTGEWKVILTECPLCASGLPPASNATGVATAVDNVSVGGDNNAETPSAPTARGEGRTLNNSLDLPLTDNDATDDDDDDDSSYISTRSSRSSISYTPRTSSTHQHHVDRLYWYQSFITVFQLWRGG